MSSIDRDGSKTTLHPVSPQSIPSSSIPFTVCTRGGGTISFIGNRCKPLVEFFKLKKVWNILRKIQPFSEEIEIEGRIQDVQEHFLDIARAYLDFAQTPKENSLEKHGKFAKYRGLVKEKGFQKVSFVARKTIKNVKGPKPEIAEPIREVAIRMGSEGFETEGYLITSVLSDELGPILGEIKALQPSLEKIKITGKRTNIDAHLLKIAKAYLTFCQTSSEEKYEEAVRESGLEVAFCVEGEVAVETFHEKGELDALFTEDLAEVEMESSVSTAFLEEEGAQEISEKPAKKSRRKEPAAETETAEFDEIEAPVGPSVKGILREDGTIAWEGSIPSANLQDIEEIVREIAKKFTGTSRGIKIQVMRENPDWDQFVRAMRHFRDFFCYFQEYKSHAQSAWYQNRLNYIDAANKAGFAVDFMGTQERWTRKTKRTKSRIEEQMQKSAPAASRKAPS